MIKVKINVVTSIAPEIWENQISLCPDETRIFKFSKYPIEADFTIVFGETYGMKVFSPRSRTVFLMTEPPEIMIYPDEFLSQFGIVAGPDFSYLPKFQNRILCEPYIPWHIGVDYSSISPILRRLITLSETPIPSNSGISVITSGKRITRNQRQRIRFIKAVQKSFPNETRIFGRDSVRVTDKAEVLSQFRYHLALENSVHPYYWTEKLSDSVFLRNTVFYSGDPRIKEDFPGESIIPIDIFDIPSSLALIRKTIENENIDDFVSSLENSRKRLVERHSIQNLVTRIINSYVGGSVEQPNWELRAANLKAGRFVRKMRALKQTSLS